MKLPFEKALDGDAFKDSLKCEDCILILKKGMENIEKKMEELCIATKSAKQSELQLVSMNEAINFISEKFDKLEKHRREKGKIIKICQKKTNKKKHIWSGPKVWQIREFSGPTRIIFT